MKIKINGKEEFIDKAIRLSEIILKKKLCAEKIVIEHNLSIIPKEEWQEIVLKENDSIEIISFVGGG